MRPLLRTGLATAALVLIATPLAAQEWIADIKATPQRHMNREVTIEGQVMATQPNPVGTTRGLYQVVDDPDNDPDGIWVRTRELPPVGQEFQVTGTVIQLQQPPTPQAGQGATIALDEISRSPAGRPGWLIPALVIAGIVVLILLVMLILTLTRDRKPAAAEPAAPTAGPTVRPSPPASQGTPSPPPAAGASGTAGSTPTAAAGDRTEAVTSSGDRTEVFRNLGATFAITGGPDAGKEFPIGKTTTLIGRAGRRKNDVELTDTAVSREQAKVVYNDETKSFTVINESKTNPTKVDGTTVEARELTDEARIEMGKTTAELRRE